MSEVKCLQCVHSTFSGKYTYNRDKKGLCHGILDAGPFEIELEGKDMSICSNWTSPQNKLFDRIDSIKDALSDILAQAATYSDVTQAERFMHSSVYKIIHQL